MAHISANFDLTLSLFGDILKESDEYSVMIKDDAMEKKDATVIDLDKLEKNAALTKEELIYMEECDSLCDTIREKVKNNVESARQTPEELVCQPCFFINGGRGSGKTTLLRAVRKHICAHDATTGEKIYELAAIDPTELAVTENFFIHILGRIQKSLLELKSMSALSDENKAHFRNARESIQKMSKGLGLLLRRPGDGSNSTDSEFFVQQSVDDCVSGFELKQEFARLVETLCKLRNVDALLVTVDDADMNFNKCSEIFETVRKYLINARMVFVFAGDLKLYTMVVRGMQMRHFGKLLLEYDSDRKEHRFNLLDVLEDQYAMKLFPVENRESLSDFSGVLHRKIKIKDSEGKKIDLEHYLREHLASMVKEHYYPVIADFLRRLTTRSALQLIAYWVKNIRPGVAQPLSAVWTEGIRQIAMQSLIKHKVDSLAIHHEGLPALIPAVIRHAQSLKHGVNGAALTSDMGDDSQKMVSFFLLSEVMRFVQSPASLLQYVLRTFPALESTSDELSIEQHLYSEGSRQWGAECTARMLPKMNLLESEGKLFANGVIPLLSQSQEVGYGSIARISAQNFVNKLIETVESHHDADVACAGLAICHSFSHVVERGRGLYCLSVFNLLNTVCLLMEIKQISEISLRESINDVLLGATTIPVVSRQATSSSVDKRRIQDTSDVQVIKGGESCDFRKLRFSQINKEINQVVDRIYKWRINMKHEEIVVPPYELRNLWSSFILSCQLVTNSAKLESLDAKSLAQAGILFKRYLQAFLEYGGQTGSPQLRKLMIAIEECPLCEWWINATDDVSVVFACCNQINIGPVQLHMTREDAENFVSMKLQTEEDTIRNHGEHYFENVVGNSKREMAEMCIIASNQSRKDCEFELIPLYEQFVALKKKRGLRKGGMGKREKEKYIRRFVESIQFELGTVCENSQLNINDLYRKCKEDYERILATDIDERTKSICQNFGSVSNERELSDLIKNKTRGIVGEYEILRSSKGRNLARSCHDYMKQVRQNVERLIKDTIMRRREELMRNIRALGE